MHITRAFVQSLTSNHVVVPDSALKTVNAFVREATSSALRLATQCPVEPASIVNKHELIDLVAQAGLPQDFDAVEVYVLSLMAGSVNRLHLPEHNLALRRGITARTHDLLEARPELLHPKLRFAKQAREGETPLLRLLVLNGVALDPSRLQAMAARGEFASEVLEVALQHGKDIGAPLFEAALGRTTGCASTALAILKADPEPQELDDHLLQRLWSGMAAAASCRQFQFDSYLELLGELRAQQDAAGGDGHRFPWAGEWSTELVHNPAHASARGAHPVFGLIFDTTVISAVDDNNRDSEVFDFPERPMSLGADALNALLEPNCRLELGRLSGMDLLSLTALCPAAAESGPVEGFWRGARATSPSHSPRAMLRWAIDTAAAQGKPISIEFFDASHQLKKLLGDQHASVRAHVVSALMSHTISASPPSMAPAVAPRPARRSQGI